MSSVAAVRAALKAQFRASLTAAGVDASVFYGHPGQEIPARFVSVSTTAEGLARKQQRMPLSATAMEEDYGLRVVVWAFVGDHDEDAQKAATDAAWLIADTIEAGLRAETTLGGIVQWALFTDLDDDDFLLNEGRAAQITCTVTVHKTRA